MVPMQPLEEYEQPVSFLSLDIENGAYTEPRARIAATDILDFLLISVCRIKAIGSKANTQSVTAIIAP